MKKPHKNPAPGSLCGGCRSIREQERLLKDLAAESPRRRWLYDQQIAILRSAYFRQCLVDDDSSDSGFTLFDIIEHHRLGRTLALALVSGSGSHALNWQSLVEWGFVECDERDERDERDPQFRVTRKGRAALSNMRLRIPHPH